MNGGTADTSSSSGLGNALRGFAVLAVSNALGQILGLLALAFVTRRVGAAALGNYNFALTTATFLGLSVAGIGYVGWRDASRDRRRRLNVISETLTLQAGVGILSYLALVAVFSPLAPNHQARTLVPIVGLNLLIAAATLDWLLLMVQRRALVAGARLLGQVCYAALVPVLVTTTSGPRPYAWLNALGLAVTATVIAVAVVRRRMIRYRLPRLARLVRRVRRSVALSYSLAMITVYSVADVLILGYLADAHQVGIYTVANRLPLSVTTLANLWLQAFFPQAAAQLHDDPEAFRRDLAATLSGAIVVALAIAGGAAVTASKLMPALFGAAFRDSATPFAILAAAMSLVLVEAVLSNVLIAGGRDRAYAVVVTLAALVNVALNFALVPAFDATGSAIATLSTEALLVLATIVAGRNVVGQVPIDWARLGRGVISVATMCGTILLLRGSASIWVAIAGGLGAFLLAVALTRPFDPHLWKRSGPVGGDA